MKAFLQKILVERTNATSRFINRSNIWEKIMAVEKN